MRISTGLTLYYIYCGNKPVFSIELEIPTWKILPWDKLHTTSNLMAMRTHQLQRRDDDFEEAVHYLQRMRLERKGRYDEKHDIRKEKLAKSNIVSRRNIGSTT